MEEWQEPSLEKLKETLITKLVFFYPKVIDTRNRFMISGFLDNLNDNILASSKIVSKEKKYTTMCTGFTKDERKDLSKLLSEKESSEERAEMLLNALKDRGLEEDPFLKILREIKMNNSAI